MMLAGLGFHLGWQDTYKNGFVYCGLKSPVDELRQMIHACFDEADSTLYDESMYIIIIIWLFEEMY